MSQHLLFLRFSCGLKWIAVSNVANLYFQKRRSFLLCFMRTIYIAMFYILAESVGYTIFLTKGFRMSSAGLGIGKSDSDILSIVFIVFHVATVVFFRMFAFYSALRFRKEIPRVARRVNVRNYFRTHGHLHHDQRYNRRMLIIENNWVVLLKIN